MKNHYWRGHRVFYVLFGVILVTLMVALLLYCRTFNGGISQDPSDWSAFATFIGSIGTMLFTALNVWVFFYLTSSIAQYNDQFVLKEKQMECINSFSHTLSVVFPISPYNEPMCDIPDKYLGKALDWFRNFKSHKDILPTLNEEAYDRFIDQYQEFCRSYIEYSDYCNLGQIEKAEIVFEGHQPEADYFDLYLVARKIKLKMIEEVIDIKF